MKKRYKILLGLIILIAIWWIAAAPPADWQIGSAHNFEQTPKAIQDVTTEDDFLKENIAKLPSEMKGYDDVAFQDNTAFAYLSGMDGWIWQLNRETGKSTPWVDMPLIPAGMRFSPVNSKELYACTARLGGKKANPNEKVGLYKVNVETKKVEPVLLKLPKTETTPVHTTFHPSKRPTFKLSELNDKNSRDFCLCNDMAISEDGQRIYISEPVFSQRAAMGPGATIEAIGLAPIGKMWQLDLANNTVSLIVDNYTFVDGMLLETKDSIENAVFFTETIKFSMLKTYLSGDKAGTTEIVWENLPGMLDGLERDKDGNIWTGIIKERSSTVNWVHANPWIKPFLVRVPQSLLPVSKKTGIMAFSPDGKIPLFYSLHDGSELYDISVACPVGNELFYPVFSEELSGVFFSKNPLLQ